MTMTVHQFMTQSKYRDPTRLNIAGYIYNNGNGSFHFYYYESDNLSLPAVINMLEDQWVTRRDTIYTNLPVGHWITEYRGDQVYCTGLPKSHWDDGRLQVNPELATGKRWPKKIIGADLAAPLTQGLHYAARMIMGNKGDPKPGPNLGVVNALRYYMLATYSLLDISGEESFNGLNNFVAASLVNDQGKILATGINTGSYRHAEVSMLINYFRANPEQKKLPAKSVVFSTLTPCRQCTNYLKDTKAADTVIYFGQEDTGKLGRVGKSISAALSTKTGGAKGQSKTDLTGLGVASDCSPSGVHEVMISSALANCMMPNSSIASQIGKGTSRKVLATASTALINEVLRDRATGDTQQSIESAVLHYVTGWLGRVTSS